MFSTRNIVDESFVDYAKAHLVNDIQPDRLHLALGHVFRPIATLFTGMPNSCRARNVFHTRISEMSKRVKLSELNVDAVIRTVRDAVAESQIIMQEASQEDIPPFLNTFQGQLRISA